MYERTVEPTTTDLPDGQVLIAGCIKMDVPRGSPHQRSLELRFPAFERRPVVVATIEGPNAGIVFGMHQVTVNDWTTQTQIAFNAQTTLDNGERPFDGDLFCNFLIIGWPRKPGKSA